MTKAWRSYEEVAEFLLRQMAREFGLVTVEGKQAIHGLDSGTEWEIDAKGVREGETGFLVIECRRYTTQRLDQESVAAIAYRIDDTGADGGIVVSPLGLQQGALKVAEAAGVVSVTLDPGSTTKDYVLRFLNKVFVGVSGEVRLIGRATVVKIKKSGDEAQ